MHSESGLEHKVRASEVDAESGIARMESLFNVEEVETGAQRTCGQALLIENNDNHPEDQGDAHIELIGGRDVYPATPSPDRGSLELSSSSDQSEDHDSILGRQTPKENIFDPFAPGPEELVFAPKKKMLMGRQMPPRRQLNFNDCDDSAIKVKCIDSEGAAADDHLLELVFQSFLRLIVSNQTQEMSAGNLPGHCSPTECLKTPISLPLLTGIAGTCPSAPRRQPAKSRNFSPGVCRKLEFGTDLI